MYLRSAGRRLDPSRDLTAAAEWLQPESHWMSIGRYHAQLKRYYDAFPREQIGDLLFDDFRKRPLEVVQDIYRFLRVEPDLRARLRDPPQRRGHSRQPVAGGAVHQQDPQDHHQGLGSPGGSELGAAASHPESTAGASHPG